MKKKLLLLIWGLIIIYLNINYSIAVDESSDYISLNRNEQILKNGYYEIAVAVNEKKVLDVSSASKENQANIQVWEKANVDQQKFEFTYKNGYYIIQNVNSKKVLDVMGGNAQSGTNVWQYEFNNTNAQKWTIRKNEDETYSIISALDENLLLNVENENAINGTNVNVKNANNTASQKFILKEVNVVIPKRTIKDGIYKITMSSNFNKVIDISAASKNNGANVQIWDYVDAKQQKFKITCDNEGYYTIKNINSNKVLDVVGGAKASGTNIWQYEPNNTDAQKWIIQEKKDNTYSIISKLDYNLQLNVENGNTRNGTNVNIQIANDNYSQKFIFKEVEAVFPEKTINDGIYKIMMSNNSNKVIDVSAASKNNEANIQIWDYADANQQKFKITCNDQGYYTIKNVNSNKVLDVKSGNAQSGTNIWQYEANNTDAQKWIIIKNSDNTYKIISALDENLRLNVENGNTSNGTNVNIQTANDSNSQKFIFKEVEAIIPEKTINDGVYKIMMSSNYNKVIDVSAASKENQANIQIWDYSNVLQQKFLIACDKDGYYTIKNINSKKMLDVSYGAGVSGGNVWQYDFNNTNAQKWIIKRNSDNSYNIISALNDTLYLTVQNGYTSNGTNIEIYTKNNKESQKFKFEQVTAIECEEGTYGLSGLKIKGDSRGQELKYYKIGNGPNVFFGAFSVHGWEDNFDFDGQELTKIAEHFKNKLIDMQDEKLANKWTVYLLPSINPDGQNHGWTHNGPRKNITLFCSS